MSRNIETVNTYLDGFRKNDHAQILSCLTDDIEWTVFGGFHLTGKDAYDKAIDGPPELLNPPHLEVVRMVEQGDVVMAELTGTVKRAVRLGPSPGPGLDGRQRVRFVYEVSLANFVATHFSCSPLLWTSCVLRNRLTKATHACHCCRQHQKSDDVRRCAIMVRPSPDPHESIYAFMAYYLRFLRVQHNVTQADVAKILNCSIGQVSKYETGEKQFGTRECAALDKEWNTGNVFTIWLGYAKLGIDANAPSRLDRYQRKAVEHCIFSSSIVPIPLQTEGYARCLLEAGHAAGLIEDVEIAVALRMDLQAAILDGRPDLWVVLDEIALRSMGSSQVMADQWDKLAEMGQLHHVSVRILPLSAAPHTGVDGSYWCFTLPGRRLAAHSGNALGMGRVIDDQTEAADVARRFQRLAARAWNEDQSRQYLSRMGEINDGLAQE
ncbi:Scr1 family TA system antitoxin-like transcriptional regulator [Spirillospora sp. NPDC048824]|uniref:Scr1 family TA system antitoxin-like transcriptional regulator n=1 Tax=Spirillospora sp. NPDC048824 TaxID=3364526 RepID=UPI0037209352